MSLFTLQTSDQQQYGPVESETLRAWARERRIERDNHIYDHTHLKWVEAAQLPEISDFFSPPSEVHQPSASAVMNQENDSSPAQTDDPMMAIRKAVAMHAENSRNNTHTSHPNKARNSSSRLKIPRDLPRGEVHPVNSTKTHGMNAAKRRTSMLVRITKIFPNPFSKKKQHHAKKQSQRITQRVKQTHPT